jgi:hypothetical protein
LKTENPIEHSIIRIAIFAIIFFAGHFYLKKYYGSWDALFVLGIFGLIFSVFGIFLFIESIILNKKKKLKSRNINLILIPFFITLIVIYLNI